MNFATKTAILLHVRNIEASHPLGHPVYYLRSHRCPNFRPCFCVSVIPSFRHTFRHTSKFYRKCLPGGARQNPRSGFFLVFTKLQKFEFSHCFCFWFRNRQLKAQSVTKWPVFCRGNQCDYIYSRIEFVDNLYRHLNNSFYKLLWLPWSWIIAWYYQNFKIQIFL